MLTVARQTGHILYRIWFHILVAVPIILFLPFLVVFATRESWYPQFFWMARNLWAKPILYGMFCWPKVTYEERLVKGSSYMLVANHTSMLDIMLMLAVSKNPFVFVGKKELVNIPLFGFFYKRVCIMVDREDTQSRTGVYRRAQKRLQQGLSICIFPEGGVPEEHVVLDNFKDGAFKMAISHKIPIVPMTFLDNKKRFSFTFLSGGPGKCRAKVHSFVDTEALKPEDTSTLRRSVREIILNDLINKS
ncbi:lysophospholipid acyltransferase family protein [Maribacter hydrothermalis]|uniref:1-acyl-sn-glycerol-3-phosphate acyltransferase n=1 Tax=Maribacter hydrothermalis TaxID=1836467 RepID=A0A1B7ZEA4_9FLAO|nr:lysophospholipid acyltransferase family protein [Maribacter hydrothermalis]APQ17412.1 1-acyl-sn-glycerol-3-phosphate acyltransferase [Maribacter hydrothermalis]OBR41890.1 acyl-phosphate glycerol 3-phosphate acyltransferase [Maribacter hydrothermalis]